MIDMQTMVNDLWNGPHPPRVEPSGSQVRLVHPFGQAVVFDLHRKDIDRTPQDFADAVLAPQIVALKQKIPAS